MPHFHAAVKCVKTNCTFCTTKCNMPYCGELDFAFVSRAYVDACSCPTNVTSHNPEKLHQSHLITHIHDAVLHSAGSVLLFQATQLRNGWVKRRSSHWFSASPHEQQLDNATLPLRHLLKSETIKETVFDFVIWAAFPTLAGPFANILAMSQIMTRKDFVIYYWLNWPLLKNSLHIWDKGLKGADEFQQPVKWIIVYCIRLGAGSRLCPCYGKQWLFQSQFPNSSFNRTIVPPALIRGQSEMVRGVKAGEGVTKGQEGKIGV